MVTRTANESLHRRYCATETKENMIEMFEQPKMEPIFFKPAGIKLGDEANSYSTPLCPACDAVQIKEVGRIHAYKHKGLIVLLKRDCVDPRIQPVRQPMQSRAPDEPLNRPFSNKIRPTPAQCQ